MEKNYLLFSPFQSFVHSSFWHKLTEIKIDLDKLSEEPREIFGYYTNSNSNGCHLEVDYSSFNSCFNTLPSYFPAYGRLYNKNTIENFKSSNKSSILNYEGQLLLSEILSGNILKNICRLNRFLILSFADIKKYNFYYWFAFPSLLEPVCELEKTLPVEDNLAKFIFNVYNEKDESKTYFILKRKEDSFEQYNISDVISSLNRENNFKEDNIESIYFCFADPSNKLHPGWNLRPFLLLLYYLCPHLREKSLNFISVRQKTGEAMKCSKHFVIKIPNSSIDTEKFVGWERNLSQKMGPRCISLKDSMDQKRIAENSILLNLKLMKWRLVSDLNLEKISSTSCLLLGAGTLGCSVARNLLAWGFKKITFVDSGVVHHSNPVRQSLYLHKDAIAGNQSKAITAAQRLKEINPNIESKGYNVAIQMPGHTVGDSTKDQLIQDLNLLEKLIQEHEVIFLLTDSRESRWLPTVLGAFYKKIVINTALGFDSYLIMRHGSKKNDISTTLEYDGSKNLKCILGSDLGCYFCSDVTAPGNSMKDKALDQQCTVTRPGVANIAASYAVELLVSLLHHELENSAPAFFYSKNKSEEIIPEGSFGIIPHSIRGFLSSFENIMPATKSFSQCIACSNIILDEYKNRKFDFLLDVFSSCEYLLKLCGLLNFSELDEEIINCDDDDWSD